MSSGCDQTPPPAKARQRVPGPYGERYYEEGDIFEEGDIMRTRPSVQRGFKWTQCEDMGDYVLRRCAEDEDDYTEDEDTAGNDVVETGAADADMQSTAQNPAAASDRDGETTAAFRGCTRHFNRGDRETIRIFEMTNHSSNEKAYLWINSNGKILYQGLLWTTGWHGRFDEEFDDVHRGMFRLTCSPTGDENNSISITVIPVKQNQYSGLNGIGETVSLRYMRTLGQCSTCGDYYITERAGHDILPHGAAPDPAWQIWPRTGNC